MHFGHILWAFRAGDGNWDRLDEERKGEEARKLAALEEEGIVSSDPLRCEAGMW